MDAGTIVDVMRDEIAGARPDGLRALREVRRSHSRRLKAAPAELVLAVAARLVRSGSWGDRLVAFELLASHPGAFGLLDDDIVEQLAAELCDWGSVDLFGVTVSGPAWREGLVSNERITRWARSPDRWRRRLALVSTVALNVKTRGGRGDAQRTLALSRLLKADRDDMVVKAMSWALRELAKRDPASVETFLRDEGDLAPRVRREVLNKLRTGLKLPRRSGASIQPGHSGGSELTWG